MLLVNLNDLPSLGLDAVLVLLVLLLYLLLQLLLIPLLLLLQVVPLSGESVVGLLLLYLFLSLLLLSQPVLLLLYLLLALLSGYSVLVFLFALSRRGRELKFLLALVVLLLLLLLYESVVLLQVLLGANRLLVYAQPVIGVALLLLLLLVDLLLALLDRGRVGSRLKLLLTVLSRQSVLLLLLLDLFFTLVQSLYVLVVELLLLLLLFFLALHSLLLVLLLLPQDELPLALSLLLLLHSHGYLVLLPRHPGHVLYRPVYRPRETRIRWIHAVQETLVASARGWVGHRQTRLLDGYVHQAGERLESGWRWRVVLLRVVPLYDSLSSLGVWLGRRSARAVEGRRWFRLDRNLGRAAAAVAGLHLLTGYEVVHDYLTVVHRVRAVLTAALAVTDDHPRVRWNGHVCRGYRRVSDGPAVVVHGTALVHRVRVHRSALGDGTRLLGTHGCCAGVRVTGASRWRLPHHAVVPRARHWCAVSDGAGLVRRAHVAQLGRELGVRGRWYRDLGDLGRQRSLGPGRRGVHVRALGASTLFWVGVRRVVGRRRRWLGASVVGHRRRLVRLRWRL